MVSKFHRVDLCGEYHRVSFVGMTLLQELKRHAVVMPRKITLPMSQLIVTSLAFPRKDKKEKKNKHTDCTFFHAGISDQHLPQML